MTAMLGQNELLPLQNFDVSVKYYNTTTMQIIDVTCKISNSSKNTRSLNICQYSLFAVSIYVNDCVEFKYYKPVSDRFARSYLYATSMFLCLNWILRKQIFGREIIFEEFQPMW